MLANPPTPFQSASLYVGELHPEVTESTLFDLFNRVGPVASIRVCRDTITKRSLGYAYVNFHNVQDAERAIDTMNFNEIRGRPCRIMWSQRDPSLRKSGVGNIYIKNLPPSADNKNLFDVFSVFGNILSCKVASDETGSSKGYGYIHYETAEAASEAISKMNGNTLDGYVVEVLAFLRRQERSSQASWTNTYIKQFPKTWDENRIKELVSPFGETTSIALNKDNEGNSTGAAYVNFAEHESAFNAVNSINKQVIEEASQSFTLYMSRFQKKNERLRDLQSFHQQKREEKLNLYQGRNLYVKNIDDEISDEELLKLFSEHGTVSNAKIMRDVNSGVSKGFGFVCYNLPEDAQKAITALNGTRVRSKPLVVTFHQRKEVRRAHLVQNTNERFRYLPPNVPGMAPIPYNMYLPGGQTGASFQGGQQQRQMYGEFGPNAGRGGESPRGLPGQMRNQYYPLPYGSQQQQGQQPPNQQYKRIPANNSGPQQTNVGIRPGAGVLPVPNQPGRGAPYQQQTPGRGLPGQALQQPPQQFPGRGPNVKFTNQVRNPPYGQMSGMIPQIVDQQIAMQPIDNISQQFNHPDFLNLPIERQKNVIGERLYPLVRNQESARAGKITGMLLEMEITELINLLENTQALQSKVQEAVMVLEQHERSIGEQ
eukprot:gene17261-22793_t